MIVSISLSPPEHVSGKKEEPINSYLLSPSVLATIFSATILLRCKVDGKEDNCSRKLLTEIDSLRYLASPYSLHPSSSFTFCGKVELELC